MVHSAVLTDRLMSRRCPAAIAPPDRVHGARCFRDSPDCRTCTRDVTIGEHNACDIACSVLAKDSVGGSWQAEANWLTREETRRGRNAALDLSLIWTLQAKAFFTICCDSVGHHRGQLVGLRLASITL